MSDFEKIKAIVFNAIDEFNISQEIDNKLEKMEEEVLFSRAGFTQSGKLDSLTLVYFLVTIEEYLQKEFGTSFNLKTQDLIDSKEVELKNITTLIKYIQHNL
jgi:hypothetical protein